MARIDEPYDWCPTCGRTIVDDSEEHKHAGVIIRPDALKSVMVIAFISGIIVAVLAKLIGDLLLL